MFSAVMHVPWSLFMRVLIIIMQWGVVILCKYGKKIILFPRPTGIGTPPNGTLPKICYLSVGYAHDDSKITWLMSLIFFAVIMVIKQHENLFD